MKINRVLDWLHDRTGYRHGLAIALDEPVRGGASWAYVFGSVLTFILLMQAVTGVLLAMYYSPSSTDAWASVAYIQDQVSLGWFIRGLHSYGASAMVIVTGLHMLQVALYGAYKKPREMNWIVGVLMMALILAFALTGYLLPWDQKGYWATKVATGIMGSTPFVGEALQRAVQGGNEYGNLTLTRFYAIHVFILPATIFILLGIHLILFRKHGVTPKWNKTEAELDALTQPFWPDQLYRDMVIIAGTFGVMAWMTMRTHGAELGAPADPGSGYDARPEWYFLPLFQLLKYFHGAMEQVAALGVPVLAGGFLLLLPFVDRGADRSPRKRAAFLGLLGLGIVGAGSLVIVARQSDANDQGLQTRLRTEQDQAETARRLARRGVPPEGGVAVYENDLYLAKQIFKRQCAGCHQGGHDGKTRKAPIVAAGYNSRAWIRGFLTAPDSDAYFGRQQKIQALEGKMKSVDHYDVSGETLEALVEWLYLQTGAKDAKPELARKAEAALSKCTDECHSTDGESPGNGPNLGERGSPEWLEAFIARPERLRFFGENNDMPSFRGKLSVHQIQMLAEYLGTLRDEPMAPVDASGSSPSAPSPAPAAPAPGPKPEPETPEKAEPQPEPAPTPDPDREE